MTVHCRIMKIDIEKFSVDLTCRTSDLMDKANEWKLPKDSYYDFDTESEDQKLEEEFKKKQQRTREYMKYTKHIWLLKLQTALHFFLNLSSVDFNIINSYTICLWLFSIYKACDCPPQLPQHQFQPGREDDGDPGSG